jgi:translation initiation factor IF-3
MTRQHRRTPLRRSSTPERILSAGLATATCVGVVGLLGARTISANAEGTEAGSSESSTEAVEIPVDPTVSVQEANSPPTSTAGMTQAELDAYAARLAEEKDRLDAYRTKLIKTAKKLKRLAAKQAAASSTGSVVVSRPASSGGSSGKPSSTKAQAAARPQAQPAAPQQQAAQPAPKPAAAPAAKAAPKPQSNTKSS